MNRPARFALWGAGSFAATLALAALLIQPWLIRYGEHRRAKEAMDRAILALSTQRPSDLTDDQWAYCLMWTWNLHSNYGHSADWIATADLQRLARELERRTQAGADLATIDWFWDEYARACPRALRYENRRPTAPQNREAFERGDHGGNSLESWRSHFGEIRDAR